jgi:hypothetical protein
MSGLVFDYKRAAGEADLPQSLLHEFEEDARREFGDDDMLFELHILRAINGYRTANGDRLTTTAVTV